jgi:hypothetical protein
MENGNFEALPEHILGFQRIPFILTWSSFGLKRKSTYIDNYTFESLPGHTIKLLRNPFIWTLSYYGF